MNLIRPSFADTMNLAGGPGPRLEVRARPRPKAHPAQARLLRVDGWRHVFLLPPTPHGTLRGRYQIQVLDAVSKKVIQRRPWAVNLILDQGLNQVATTRVAALSTACAVGTGTTPTVRDSTGVAQLTVVGTNVTADAPFFEAGDVGRLLKLDSGGEAYISAFNTTQDVDLATAPGDTGPEDGAVWYVNQTGLAAESKRTTTYLTGVGNCGQSDVSNTRTYRRTYDFSAEAAPVNYTELGWSPSGGAGNNLFSRTLITGGSVALLTGQQLRVIYDLEWTFSPGVSTPGTTTITGWPVAPALTQDGDMIIANGIDGGNAWTQLDTAGAAVGSGGQEPSGTQYGLGFCTGATLPGYRGTYNRGSDLGGAAVTLQAYVPGSYQRITNTLTFGVGSLNSTAIRGFAHNTNGVGSGGGAIHCFVWDEAQTKANTHTLGVSHQCSWSRTLTNP